MSLLARAELLPLLNSGDEGQIFLSPILDTAQVGAVSVDLRLGCDFLVSVQSRRPSFELNRVAGDTFAEQFFQSVRRDLGDSFTVHPSQTVLAVTLEYLGLPASVYADVVSRSSYSRLGLGVHSTYQPGFRGCVSLELHNHSNIPLELVVGSKIAQVRFFKVDSAEGYFGADAGRRKYIGHVRPVASRAHRDADMNLLSSLAGPRVDRPGGRS